MTSLNEQEILALLEEVKDPEIPVLSLIDLGVIRKVEFNDQKVKVEMTPTFVGCPAMDYMKNDVIQVLKREGIKAEVEISFKTPWSSDLISEKGKAALKEFGIAAPPDSKIFTDLEILECAICPRCEKDNTELRNPFGPTLCRAIYYCRDCKEAFEQFKPV